MNSTIRWRKANGEVIGFVVCVFLLVVIIISMYAFQTYTTHSQQLCVASYAVGRAAVVSDNPADGFKRADAVLKLICSGGVTTGASTNAGDMWFEILYPEGWKIGSIAEIRVYEHMPAIFPFPEKDLCWKLAMMIEAQPEDAVKR